MSRRPRRRGRRASSRTFPVRASKGLRVVKRIVQAVSDVSFTIERRRDARSGRRESGRGKTTVGRCVLRLIEPTSGSVKFEGDELDRRSIATTMRPMRREMQIVFQDPYASLDPRLHRRRGDRRAAADPEDRRRPRQAGRRAARARRPGARPCAAVSRTSSPADSGSASASPGRWRSNPTFIVLDEPVSALDVSIQAGVVNLLQDLQDELGLSLPVHRPRPVGRAPHLRPVAVMYLGKLMEVGPAEEIYTAPAHPYTQALLSAVPEPDPRHRARPAADRAGGRRAVADQPAVRVPVPDPLPEGRGRSAPRRSRS